MSHQPDSPPPPSDSSSSRRRSRSSRRHHNQRFETAFVSSGLSSTEDLDEVDRIANHPLLRQTARLAAAATGDDEPMGGSMDRGVSSAAAFMDRRPASVTTSPVSWVGGGGGGGASRMSRSATLHTMAAGSR
jgi:hypothetical protein